MKQKVLSPTLALWEVSLELTFNFQNVLAIPIDTPLHLNLSWSMSLSVLWSQLRFRWPATLTPFPQAPQWPLDTFPEPQFCKDLSRSFLTDNSCFDIWPSSRIWHFFQLISRQLEVCCQDKQDQLDSWRDQLLPQSAASGWFPPRLSSFLQSFLLRLALCSTSGRETTTEDLSKMWLLSSSCFTQDIQFFFWALPELP